MAGVSDPGYNNSPGYDRITEMASHTHLRRLPRVWIEQPIYFVTACTKDRRELLNCESAASILVEEWHKFRSRHGWLVGRYVIMPDHVHFFCCPTHQAKSLSVVMRMWKQWTSKRLAMVVGVVGPVWQVEFFDHVLRSSESYQEKWLYVQENPVRAGLVQNQEDWPWQGELERLELPL